MIGIVIKIMDDFLDRDIDRLREQKNISDKIGPGVLPYTLLLTVFALALNFHESLALFFSSYVIGMIHIRNEKLPTKLTGQQESLIVLIVCILITSFKETLSAFLLIFLVQIADDLLDYKEDARIGRTNFVFFLGLTPTLILAVILTAFSAYFFPEKLMYFSAAVIIIFALETLIFSFCRGTD